MTIVVYISLTIYPMLTPFANVGKVHIHITILHIHSQADILPVLVHGCHTTIQLASSVEVNALICEGSTYTNVCLQLGQSMLDGLETIQYNNREKKKTVLYNNNNTLGLQGLKNQTMLYHHYYNKYYYYCTPIQYKQLT